jgi:hypothetical protein
MRSSRKSWSSGSPAPGGVGHVIITSRRTGWDGLGPVVDVDVMSSAEAVDLLRRITPGTDAQTAGEIAHLLGELPLALEQAASYLSQTGTPPAEYLHLLRTRGEELLGRGHVLGQVHTLATVWDVSQHSLQADNPAAMQLLTMCAFLGPEPIPLAMFTDHPEPLPQPLNHAAADPVRFADALGGILGRSLDRRSADGTSITVHRMLATAIRRPLTDNERHTTINIVWDLLSQHLLGQLTDDPQQWPAWRALLPHVLTAESNGAPTMAPKRTESGRILPNRKRRHVLVSLAQGEAFARRPIEEVMDELGLSRERAEQWQRVCARLAEAVYVDLASVAG